MNAGKREGSSLMRTSLSFPNSSRSYDETRQGVCFWGHDSAFEISFYVGEDALRLMSPQSHLDETALLQVFDANRQRIEDAASKAYARKRQSYYRLSPADF
jgi:hypothetical protein